MKVLQGLILALALLMAGCGPSGETGTDTSSETAAAENATPAGQDADAGASQVAQAETEPADYGDMANWLCHPGKSEDACSGDLDYTIVAADGTLDKVAFEAAENPQIDCFYVYPTISMDASPNSDLEAGPEERRVVATQFASFAEECRLFAPVYRQVTLTHLQGLMRGGEYTADEGLAFGDVRDAWQHYLETGNDGRGVVLVGHSQGARVIERLLREEVIGSKAEELVVSAMPIGYTIYGDDESGAVGPFELCMRQDQTSCLLSYVSFRSDVPPTAESRFGASDADGRRAICVNPADLSGDDGALDARLSKAGFFGLDNASFVEGATIDTPYAALPGMLSAECVESEAHTWLSVTVSGDPDDPRADDITGDVIVGGERLDDWGLHLVDMNLAMGNLLDIVGAQAEAWVAAEAAEEAEDG